MKLTPSEILKVKTKGTLNIIEDSPLHKAVISAMNYYAEQEAKAYVNWLSNQVIAGRTKERLWMDYEETKKL